MNVLVVVGPTASGKTHAGVVLARRHHGVIVSADSRQMYRELIIGAGKEGEPGQREIRGVGLVPVRTLDGVDQIGVDLWSIKEDISVHDFVARVVPMIEGLLVERIQPIVVGGSGLYVEGLLGLRVFTNVKANKARRSELEDWATGRLLRHLNALAPERAATIDLGNRRRIIRAIEIAEAKEQLAAQPQHPRWPVKIIGINPPREELYQMIDERLEERFEGIANEVQALLAEGISRARLDGLGLEYRYVAQMIAEKLPPEQTLAALKGAIHGFARRQLTWFRKMKGVDWVGDASKINL